MQLQESLARFNAAGIAVVAVSPDSVAALASFARSEGVNYPLLSDGDSVVIRALGLLNTLIREGEPEYGIPYPGSYLVAPDGRILAKRFHREYQVRETPATVLRTGFGVEPDADHRSPAAHATDLMSGVGIEARFEAPSLSFMQRADLYVSFTLPAGIHLYGDPIPEGYQALDVQVKSAATIRIGNAVSPPTRVLRIPALRETFHVLEGRPVVRIPIILTERPSATLVQLALEIRVRYQACTAVLCFAPAVAVLEIAVPAVA